MANKHTPPRLRGLGLNSEVPQPQRYEYDENVAFSPPSSSHMFKIFDSSEIFTQHPRKYPLLTSQDDSSTQASSTSAPCTEIVRPSFQKKRSKSLATCDISSADYSVLLEKAHPSLKGNKTAMPSAPIESKPKMAPASPTRRASVTIMDTPALTGLTPTEMKPGLPSDDTMLNKTRPYASSTHPVKENDTRQLSKMFKAAFGTSSSWHQNPKDSGFQEADEDNFGGTTSATRPQHEDDIFSFPTINESGNSPEMVPVTVRPEPRRLFGFGPSYQPPSETVLVPVDQAKSFSTGRGSLLDKVKTAGITAVDAPSPIKPATRGFMAVPTKEEMNTWAPFST